MNLEIGERARLVYNVAVEIHISHGLESPWKQSKREPMREDS